MSRPRLKSVTLLPNHGARIVYATPARELPRYVGPDGFLSLGEAAHLLGVPRRQLYRMAGAGRVDLYTRKGEADGMALAACRVLLALPARRRRTVRGGAVMDLYDAKRRRVRRAAGS